jgi:hypothetical protein
VGQESVRQLQWFGEHLTALLLVIVWYIFFVFVFASRSSECKTPYDGISDDLTAAVSIFHFTSVFIETGFQLLCDNSSSGISHYDWGKSHPA